MKLFRRGADPGAREELARLRLEAERAQQLVEESREIVVVLDEERRVITASRRARESIEELVEGSPLPERLLRAEGDREPVLVPYRIDGRTETLLYLSAPGDRAAYEELRTGFTAAVSHELRTPLARLLVLLENASLPGADTDELVEQSRAEVVRIGELIDDVLFLSELESGRAVVSLGSIRVLPVLEQVVEGLATAADLAGVQVEVECAASFELPVRQRMLQAIAGNLVENAIRYAGPRTMCTVCCREEAGRRLLVVADDGAGVSTGALPRLFERFYRGDRGRSTRGTGLGLAIVKHISAAAGGEVEARATEGGGLTITCSFPAT